jgi:hypothetical protein
VGENLPTGRSTSRLTLGIDGNNDALGAKSLRSGTHEFGVFYRS